MSLRNPPRSDQTRRSEFAAVPNCMADATYGRGAKDAGASGERQKAVAQRHGRTARAFVLALIVAGALIGQALPLNVNVSIIYIAAVALCAFTRSVRFVWIAAILSMAASALSLTSAEFLGRIPEWVLLNRSFVAATVILIAVLVSHLIRALSYLDERSAELAQLNTQLETRIGERTSALEAEMAERKEAEAQLHQAQKMETIGRLTGGIAHDFNNMLSIIMGNLDLLCRRLEHDESNRYRRLAENALEGAKRAAALTSGLLAFARRAPLSPKCADVNECVRSLQEVLRRALGEHIQLEIIVSGGLWKTFVDQPQLQSVLVNLAVNARDAMPDGGKLTIETGNAYLDEEYARNYSEVTPGQYVLLAVTDSGCGMTPDVKAQIFEPFFTTKAVGEGTGLGLSQAFGFAKQSKGHIAVYSEVSVGTTFKLYLPRFLGEGELAPDLLSEPLVPGERYLTVLVVEDDPDVRAFTVDALRELGHTVLHADGGEQALATLEKDASVDLLLTDVVMPGMNGRELAEKAVALRPSILIIYMTGYTRNAIIHNGRLDPGILLVTKPFTVQQLGAKIAEAIAALPSIEVIRPSEQPVDDGLSSDPTPNNEPQD